MLSWQPPPTMAECDAKQNAAILRSAVPAPLQRQIPRGHKILTNGRGVNTRDTVDVCVYSGAIVLASRFDNVYEEVLRRAVSSRHQANTTTPSGPSPTIVVQDVLAQLEASVEHVMHIIGYFSLVGDSVCKIMYVNNGF